MCFRPADAGGGSHKCPECGKTIQAMGGMKLTKCPFCKCDLTPYINGEKPIPGAPRRTSMASSPSPVLPPPPARPAPLLLLVPPRLPALPSRRLPKSIATLNAPPMSGAFSFSAGEING